MITNKESVMINLTKRHFIKSKINTTLEISRESGEDEQEQVIK